MRSRWKWSAEDLLRLEELLARGWTDRKIGESLGCSAVAVQVVRKRHGIAPRSRVLLTARTVARKLGIRCSKTVCAPAGRSGAMKPGSFQGKACW